MPNRIIRSSSFGSRSGRAGKPRKTEWLASANIAVSTVMTPSTFLFSQSLTAAELAKRPFTVTRTVGLIGILSDQVAAEEQPFGAFGMQVVSEKAIATGVTALPDPITEEGSDTWFVYQSFMASGGPLQGQAMHVFPFDSRAQRVVEDGFDIAVMAANSSSQFGLRILIKFRLLIKVA